MSSKATVGEFQGQQGLADLLPEEERGALAAAPEAPAKPALPGDVVAKFEGQAWDLLPSEMLKIGAEAELHVRVSVVGGGERRMASGVVRHHVNLKVIGVALVPFEDEVMPSMPRGNYAEPQGSDKE